MHLNHVAEEAGLTSGAVLYHYPRLSELLVDAHHSGMERFYEQRLKRISGMRDPAEKLVVTIRSGLPRDRTTRTSGCSTSSAAPRPATGCTRSC